MNTPESGTRRTTIDGFAARRADSHRLAADDHDSPDEISVPGREPNGHLRPDDEVPHHDRPAETLRLDDSRDGRFRGA